MKPLNLNETYPIKNILERQEKDHNKYIFEWDEDLTWDDNDFCNDADLLQQYYVDDEKEKFIELFNRGYESSIFKVVRIIKMRGRGVFNPLAKCQNTKLMTIKDFICAHRIECGYNIENYIFELTPVKVEKVND